MRIGILTLPLHTNYGGILQAYALQTVLERMGHDVVVINKHRVVLPGKSTLLKRYIKRVFLKYILHKNINIRTEVVKYRNYNILSQNTQQFIDRYIHSFYTNKLSALKSESIRVDAIVVGSDQIWRPKYIRSTLHDTVSNAYLGFAKSWNIKRLSYAASFGTAEWEYSESEKLVVKDLIQKFYAVSVREESGVRICENNLDINAVHVLDPTMLLSINDYTELIIKSNNTSKYNHILMNYVLDSNSEIEDFIDSISREKNLASYKLYYSNWGDGKSVQPAIEEWLSAIRDADFVITDSFHCCIFSIIFNKPFIVVGNKSRGYGRFKSLMDMFHLSRNLISEVSEYNSSFDYSIPKETYDILKQKREISNNFLAKALS